MNKKMFTKTTAMLLAAAVVASGIPANETEAAKKPKLSKTKISVRVGGSKKVTIKNAKKIKCKMKAKAKKVVKITKKSAKGLTVKGLKAGKAKITVTMINRKKRGKKTLVGTVKSVKAPKASKAP